jgi:hypothetical protein
MAPKIETTDQDITGFNLPANVVFPMGGTSVMVGGDFRTGMTIGGIVTRITHIGHGTMRLYFQGQDRSVLVFSSGMVAELAQ